MKQMLIKRAATGDCTGLRGNFSGLSGNFDACELTDAERAAGININDLINGELK